MAVPILGETLGLLQWLAIIVVVAGAVIVSANRSPGSSTRRLGRVFVLLLVSSLLMAGANIASKHALDFISFWNMYWITGLSIAAGFMLFSLRPRVVRELVDLKRRGTVLGLLAVNELLVVAGVVLLFVAMQNGPVSLVSAIFSSRPIFVLIFAFIISRTFPGFLKWQPGKGVLAQRVVGTALVVAGIAAIYLS
jgi:drug/metabolite transporter (DMT)-like permease